MQRSLFPYEYSPLPTSAPAPMAGSRSSTAASTASSLEAAPAAVVQSAVSAAPHAELSGRQNSVVISVRSCSSVVSFVIEEVLIAGTSNLVSADNTILLKHLI